MVRPSWTASTAVARTQWSVAMPTTSTAWTSRSASHLASDVGESPSMVVPSKPLYAAAKRPLRKTASTNSKAFAALGWNWAPSVPAAQCTGQVST